MARKVKLLLRGARLHIIKYHFPSIFCYRHMRVMRDIFFLLGYRFHPEIFIYMCNYATPMRQYICHESNAFFVVATALADFKHVAIFIIFGIVSNRISHIWFRNPIHFYLLQFRLLHNNKTTHNSMVIQQIQHFYLSFRLLVSPLCHTHIA